MSLLDDARRLDLLVRHPTFSSCPVCLQGLGSKGEGHRKDCPVLALPKVVTALEAAETLIATGDDCGPVIEVRNDEDGPWQALVAALKGEEPV